MVHLVLMILVLAIRIAVACMMPSGIGGGGDFNYRTPPFWSPDRDLQCSFRAFLQAIQMWIADQ
eukprot:5412678-Lingulodinium_polyedra.AAC.1